MNAKHPDQPSPISFPKKRILEPEGILLTEFLTKNIPLDRMELNPKVKPRIERRQTPAGVRYQIIYPERLGLILSDNFNDSLRRLKELAK